jgi:hypothetical protein
MIKDCNRRSLIDLKKKNKTEKQIGKEAHFRHWKSIRDEINPQ